MNPNHPKTEKELTDNVRLLREWRAWHADQLAEALVGLHRDVMARLMDQLKAQRSARELVAFIEAQDWSAVDDDARAIATLHEISQAICRLRESQNLPPIDDPLPDAPLNAFLRIRETINRFPARESSPRHLGKHRTVEDGDNE